MRRRRIERQSKLFVETRKRLFECLQEMVPRWPGNLCFGWGSPTAGWRTTRSGTSLYVSLEKSWLTTVYKEGLAILEGELTLSAARVAAGPGWDHDTWLAKRLELLPVEMMPGHSPISSVVVRYIVRHGGVACAAATTAGAIANIMLTHERNLNLEPLDDET